MHLKSSAAGGPPCSAMRYITDALGTPEGGKVLVLPDEELSQAI